MNKKIFIIGGLMIILLLLGVWVYLLVNGTPKTADDVFADLGVGGGVPTESAPLPTTDVDEERPAVNVAASRLRQLTTTPVAGFTEVQTSTTTPALVYYAEKGTGHIYTIDTESGETKRISATTFPQASTVVISNNGRYVALTTASASKSAPLIVGTLSTSTQSVVTSFEGTAMDISFNLDNELYIQDRTAGISSTLVYNPASNSSSPLFMLPFLEASIVWGSERSNSHYIYPKPASALEGQVYEASGSSITRLPVSGLGLTAVSSGERLLYTVIEDRQLKSYFYIAEVGLSEPLNSPVLTEKCVGFGAEGVFICAQDSTQANVRSREDWYMGKIHFSDSVWILDGNTFSGELLFNGREESGREIDITKLKLNQAGEVLYFINKLDNTLWMYEL